MNRDDARTLIISFVVAGFLYPLVGFATVTLATVLQPLLVSVGGFSDELLADRVAFTLVRLPLTAVFGILVAMVQYTVITAIRPLAQRWMIAAAVGGLASTLILLPSSLVLIAITENSSPEMLRLFLTLEGAALFGGFVSFFQRRMTRGKLGVPERFVAAGVLETTAGAIAGQLVLGVLGSVR